MNSSTNRTATEYKTNKFERPYCKNMPLHITMRSDIAQGDRSLRSPGTAAFIHEYLPRIAKRFRIQVFHFAIASNHLHLVVMFPERKNLSSFLRALAGNIARKALQSEKRNPVRIPFWTSRPYSRIISWGREFRNVVRYVERNVLEADGRILYTTRSEKPSQTVRSEIDRNLAMATGQLAFRM